LRTHTHRAGLPENVSSSRPNLPTVIHYQSGKPGPPVPPIFGGEETRSVGDRVELDPFDDAICETEGFRPATAPRFRMEPPLWKPMSGSDLLQARVARMLAGAGWSVVLFWVALTAGLGLWSEIEWVIAWIKGGRL